MNSPARNPRWGAGLFHHLLAKELDHDDGEVTAAMKVKRSSFE